VPRTVLLDLDGTLTDPRDGIVRSIRHALERLGAPCPPDDHLVRYIGPPLRASFGELLGTRDRARMDQAVALYRERYRPIGLFENAVYDGIPQALDALRAGGHRLILCTAKPAEYAEEILVHFGLRGAFAAVHGAELDGTRVDKAELMAWLLPREDVDPADAVMVGDREHDVVAARANGVRALGVLWGYGSAAELTAAGAEALLERPAELAAAVR
jgi:phosphoglycolate phosphatase